MKHVIALFFVLFSLNTCFGQILSLKDLIKINEMPFEKYHDYATSKRYKLYEMVNDQKLESFTYAFGQNHTNVYATRVVIKYEYKNTNRRSVSYQTLTSGDFYYISNQIASRGLLLTKPPGSMASRNQVYQLGKSQVTLITDQGFSPDGLPIQFYQVLITTTD